MNEIIPPQGVKKTSKVPARYCLTLYVVYMVLAVAFLAWAIVYLLYTLDVVQFSLKHSIVGIIFSIACFLFAGISFLYIWAISQAQHSLAVSVVDKFHGKDIITLQELVPLLRWPIFSKFNAVTIIKQAIRKGYLTNYKYVISEGTLVRLV